MNQRKPWEHFEVAFTGPFFTGTPLRVRLADYRRVQREIGDELCRMGPGWDYQSIKWQGVESYGSGGGYNNVVPLVLVRREGDALIQKIGELERTRPAAEREWLQKITQGWIWKLRAVTIELYDLGVGVISGRYEVIAPPGLSPEETCIAAEAPARLMHPLSGDRSATAAAFDLLAREAVADFARAADLQAEKHKQKPWLQPLIDALSEDIDEIGADGGANQWGRLLWLHPVFLLDAGGNATEERIREISSPFEATFSKPIKYWHGRFVPGIDSSVVVMRRGGAIGRRPPMRLILLMWAYYGLFMEMDRGLLAMLDNDRWEKSNSLSDLEGDADMIFALASRVQEARARLDSALTDLAGGQLSIWNGIAWVQKFEELVAAVEGKLASLERIADRRVQQASAARARRTGSVLSGLTALTVVTVTVALMGNFFGTPTAFGNTGVRIIAIVASFLLAYLLYRETQREITRWRGNR